MAQIPHIPSPTDEQPPDYAGQPHQSTQHPHPQLPEQHIPFADGLSVDALVAPRWRKVLGDLWGNKLRTMLVVLSIFIGIFAVGMIAGAQTILSEGLRENYARIKPAHATIATGGSIGVNEDFTISTINTNDEGFTEELVDVVRHMDVVDDAEGRRNFSARVRVGDEWKGIKFIAIDDFDDMRMDIIRHVRGNWHPAKKEVLIERSGLQSLHKDVGDTILIERPDGKQRELRIAGIAHDLTEWPTPFLGTFYGYITFDTMEWLGEPRKYNEMLIRVAGDSSNQQHNEVIAEQVYEKIQKSGRDPSFPNVPTPGEHPLNFLIVAIISLMGLLAIFSILLSGFLVTNTISALLAQQIKQIGMMKSVGARTAQIMSIYIVLVLCFGLIALVPAIPLAKVAAYGFASFIAAFLNFDLVETTMPLAVILLQVAISLIIPVVAALIPIYSGARMSIREALSNESGSGEYGTGRIDQFIQGLRGLPRPVLLAIRNTFRRKARIVLTLTTLTIGGAFFISVFSIKDSLWVTMDSMIYSLYKYDVDMYLDRMYNAESVEAEALSIPGVVAAESLIQTTVRRIYPDDSESLDIRMFAVPPNTQTMEPQIVEGRWLKQNDEHALVVSTGTRHDDPDIGVGSEIVLRINERESTWLVVGMMKAMGESRWAYASYDYYGRVARDVGKTSYVRVVTEQHTPEFQTRTAKALEAHFKRSSVDISYTKTKHELSQGDREAIHVITISLMLVAILVAIVGGLGLAGTMSLNVIERTREIGIMRSIGASDGSVLQIFMIEGILIGAISWFLGTLVSVPLGHVLSQSLGMMLFAMPLSFQFSVQGMVIWLIFSVVLSAVASFLPAWRATRISIRNVLAYE